jgi:hypothetical protein
MLSVALLAVETPVFAAEVQQASRSAGKLKQDQGIDLAAELEQRELVVKDRPEAPENYAESPTAQRLEGVANRHDQLFEIYDADVQLTADFDGDGYHHALNVVFDVDVSYDAATVYAKLYEVATELVDGYAPGYYDVLVEIYSLDHAYMVASEVLDYHYLGKDITLEALYWDEVYVSAHGGVSVSSGAGSMATLLLFFLVIQVVIAARGALALTPCKKSDDNKKNRLP